MLEDFIGNWSPMNSFNALCQAVSQRELIEHVKHSIIPNLFSRRAGLNKSDPSYPSRYLPVPSQQWKHQNNV